MHVTEFGLFPTKDFIDELPDIVAPEIKTPENEENFTNAPLETEEENIFNELFTPGVEPTTTPTPKPQAQNTIFNDPPRKNTEFRYLLERKSFRMMRKHYKDTFE